MSASPNFPSIPKDWKVSAEYLKTDTHAIHLRIWEAPHKMTGKTLLIVHGQGEQSGRYEHFPHYVRHQVDRVVALDLPGHGLTNRLGVSSSQKDRGHIEEFREYLEAVKCTLNFMSQAYPSDVFYLFGHSLGGLVVLFTTCMERHLKIYKVFACAPLLQLGFPVPPVKKYFGELLEPLIGRIQLSNELHADDVSRDKSVVETYLKDPLNHGLTTPRFFVHMNQARKIVLAYKDLYPYHLTLLTPLSDHIVDPYTTIAWYKRLTMAEGKIKNLEMLPGYFHESFNDLGKERAFNILENWLSR